MNLLRKRTVLAFWATLIIFSITFVALWILLLSSQGWPEVRYQNMSGEFRLVSLSTSLLFLNIPDIISVIIYLVIWHHYAKQSSVHPAEPPLQLNEGGGGVFPAENVSINTFDDYFIDAEIPGMNEEDEAGENNDHQKDSVLRVLKIHVLLASCDTLFIIILILIPNANTRDFFSCHFHLLVAFWLPMFVIKRGFRKMDNLTEDIKNIFWCEMNDEESDN